MISTDTYIQPFDVAEIRKQFPVLKRKVNGKNLVYFDNAATAQKPQVVIDALVKYYHQYNANIHRGIHSLAEEATAAFEATRDTVKEFINARYREEIIFTRGVTEGINLVAATYGRQNIKEGDEIIISAMEHHSNIVPWQMLCLEKKAILKVIPVDDKGELVMSAFEKLITPRTKMVSIVHASNSLGTINPVKEIIDIAHQHNIVVLVDGAQSSVHLDIDVQAMDCDFFVISSHKVYGPTGVGVLYGKKELLEEMPPYMGGGEMIKEVTFDKTTYNELPYKFEAGTPNIADTVAFKAALDFVNEVGKENICKHEEMLTKYAMDKLSKIDGVRLIGTAKHKTSVVSFIRDRKSAYDTGVLLDGFGIAVRTGHHCCQPLMNRFGIPGTIRASFAMYNTKEEIDELVSSLEEILKKKEMIIVASIEEIENELIEDFSLFESSNDKNFYLMDLGEKLDPLDDKYKIEDNKIRGCQSQVWLISYPENDRIIFKADSDSDITKGLISLLIRILSCQTFDEVIKFDLPGFMSKIQLNNFITQRRSNGFLSMVERMKKDALVYKTKLNS